MIHEKKKKEDTLDFIKSKNFCFTKDIVKRRVENQKRNSLKRVSDKKMIIPQIDRQGTIYSPSKS